MVGEEEEEDEEEARGTEEEDKKRAPIEERLLVASALLLLAGRGSGLPCALLRVTGTTRLAGAARVEAAGKNTGLLRRESARMQFEEGG